MVEVATPVVLLELARLLPHVWPDLCPSFSCLPLKRLKLALICPLHRYRFGEGYSLTC